jgi:hypothetical protein
VHTTKQIASVLEWQILRVLLWAIRQIGFRLVLDRDRMIYEWVSDSDGAFDHWFRSVDEHCAVGSVRQQLGFWRLLWQISSRSQLLVGASRRSYKCRVVVRSEEYYCTEPIFSVRALSLRPATSVNASARLVIDADCTTCGQIRGLSLTPAATQHLALAHVAETGHVVVLNGTADLLTAQPE